MTGRFGRDAAGDDWQLCGTRKSRISALHGQYGPRYPGPAPLHGAFKVDIRPGDKAVHIGTVQYFRDEFFDTTKVVVKDNYAKANAEFRQKFGQQFTLRKALAVPVTMPR